MKTITLWGLMVVMLAGWVAAQTASAPPATAPQAQSANSFAPGTTIPVELSKSLDAKKAKTGDRIEARIPADLLSQGKIVIPRSAKIIGHVVDAKAHSKESPDSRVTIAFDQMVMKDGRAVPLKAVVQAMARPLQTAPPPDSHMNEGSGVPSASPSTAGGGGMGTPRSSERVASIPTDVATDATPAATPAPLGPTSQGVVGMKGLTLQASEQSTVISSETDNVHLDGGTQMILRVE